MKNVLGTLRYWDYCIFSCLNASGIRDGELAVLMHLWCRIILWCNILSLLTTTHALLRRFYIPSQEVCGFSRNHWEAAFITLQYLTLMRRTISNGHMFWCHTKAVQDCIGTGSRQVLTVVGNFHFTEGGSRRLEKKLQSLGLLTSVSKDTGKWNKRPQQNKWRQPTT